MYQIVRIDPHATEDACVLGWRSTRVFPTRQAATEIAALMADGAHKSGSHPDSVYVAVREGGDPLVDPDAVVLSAVQGAEYATAF